MKIRLIVTILCLTAAAAGGRACAQCPDFAEFDARQARIAGRIEQARQSGMLSEAQAEKFRKRLERVGACLARHKERLCLSSFDSRHLSQDLGKIGSDLSRCLRNRQTASASAVKSN